VTPVEFKVWAALRAARTPDGVEIGPAPKNARPREAAVTPRCGGRSGAPHLWAEDGDGPAPDGAPGRPVPPWFSCGPGSRTADAGCAWRDCKWVSWMILDKLKIVPKAWERVNAGWFLLLEEDDDAAWRLFTGRLDPKSGETLRCPPACWPHGVPPAAGSFPHVLFSTRRGSGLPRPFL
jgi:hypothetical protein